MGLVNARGVILIMCFSSKSMLFSMEFLLIHTDFREKGLPIFSVIALIGNTNLIIYSYLHTESFVRFLPCTCGECVFMSHAPTSVIFAAAEHSPQPVYYKLLLTHSGGEK